MDRKTLMLIIAAPMLMAACAVPSHSGDPIAYATDGAASGVLGEPSGRRANMNAAVAIGGVPSETRVGNEIGRSSRVDNTRYRIIVRLDSGVMMTVEDNGTDLRAGDRVSVENNRVKRV